MLTTSSNCQHSAGMIHQAHRSSGSVAAETKELTLPYSSFKNTVDASHTAEKVGSTCNYCAMLSGAAAGAVGVMVGQPFDTLKVRMQIARHGAPAMQHGGLRGMYRGVLPPILTSGTVSSLNFLGFETVKAWLHPPISAAAAAAAGTTSADSSSAPPPLHIFWAAGCLGCLPVTLITCPSVLIKVQQQCAPERIGMLKCLRNIVRVAGVRGLYRGYCLHAALEGFGRGCYMSAYEAAKRALDSEYAAGRRSADGGGMPLHRRGLAGAAAGVVGWLSIYPLDVVRSRINAQPVSPPGIGGGKYAGALDCAVKTYREGGVRPFFRGLTFSMIRAAPVAMLVLPTYDLVHSFLVSLSKGADL